MVVRQITETLEDNRRGKNKDEHIRLKRVIGRRIERQRNCNVDHTGHPDRSASTHSRQPKRFEYIVLLSLVILYYDVCHLEGLVCHTDIGTPNNRLLPGDPKEQ